MNAIKVISITDVFSRIANKIILPVVFISFLLIPVSCSTDMQLPELLTDESLLGTTKATHSLTRGHDRKIIYDPHFKHWYIFWLRIDDKQNQNNTAEGVVYQFSSDGLSWSQPKVIDSKQKTGITGWDVIAVGNRLYLLGGSTNYPYTPDEPTNCSIRELEIQADGSLLIKKTIIVHDNSGGDATSLYFYGTLIRDSQGYFWTAARAGDSTPGTHAMVIRSTEPDNIAAWGPKGCTGKPCNREWFNPYTKGGRNLYQGTIANRLLDLGKHGVGLMTYNNNDADSNKNNAMGQILFIRNSSHAHDGWESSSILLTGQVNQHGKAGSHPNADKTRLDDRRFTAVVDPQTNVIHVAYIAKDLDTPENANLRYFTLSPPYRLKDKSVETTIINKEVDGVQASIDTRYSPSILYLFYVANDDPSYQIRMISKTKTGWSSTSGISNSAGYVRYPQSPEIISKDEIVIGYQYSNEQPNGRFLYRICVRKIGLHTKHDTSK